MFWGFIGLHNFLTCVTGAHHWLLCISVIFHLHGSNTVTYPAGVFDAKQMRLCTLGACVHSVVVAAVCMKEEASRDLKGWQSPRVLPLA